MSSADLQKLSCNVERIYQTLRPELEAMLQQALEWSLPQQLEMKNEVQVPDKFDELNPYLTERQRQLKWYWDHFGYLGIHYWIYAIACNEASTEAQLGIGAYRNKASRTTIEDDEGSHDEDEREEDDEEAPDVEMNSPIRDNSQHFTIVQAESEASTTCQQNSTENQIPVGGHYSWTRIIEDYEKGSESRCLYYLLSLHPSLVEALISGDLPSRMFEKYFRREVKPFTDCKPGPGTYGVFVALDEQVDNGNSQRGQTEIMAGRGLTLRHLMKATNVMRRYVDFKHPKSAELAKKIDNQFRQCPELDYSYQRRYAGGSANNDVEKHKAWLKMVEDEFMSKVYPLHGTARDYRLDIPMKRCFVYVGRSSNVMNRTSNHWWHGKSASPLFGLFTAVINYLFTDEYVLKPYSFQILRTASPDDVGLDEILTTILCSGYFWDLGLNYVHASGHSAQHQFDDQFIHSFAKNAQWISQQGLQESNLREDIKRLEKTRQLLNAQKQMPEKIQYLDREHKDNQEKLASLAEKFDLLEALTNADIIDAIINRYNDDI